MPIVYRSMHADPDDGLPLVHQSVKGLCIRRDWDIFPDEEGNVVPVEQGLTVRPTIEDIPEDFRRGQWVVWEIDTDSLGANLHYVQDADDHGVFEPSGKMTFEDYEDAILETRSDWRRSG